MKVIADFCLVPMGVGTSVSQYIKACQPIFKKYGLKTNIHAYGTNLEGEWEPVFQAIHECHEKIHSMGAPRISSTLKFGTRLDKDQTIDSKINAVL